MEQNRSWEASSCLYN